ncbi:GTPase Era [Malacoplasma iowae]|uniref:GTPase Era n=2 Tax=Malacoplasma iowae TaxID=2116 RepID=A0A6P1LHW9_MALIO|nr:GTPase Era [Malacoplasma iowae]VEU62639.1 GTP-binding protein Era [Mycoplasmopsis fermentans]EGZ31292.1 GTP-binding protein Era-like protein [Malacoplasma iowae 695]QHG89695.1 GTPase Era [Malacoplasma iowae 695]WPL35514.1 GTPase Era [Malacoplasma iowae]WPL39094.1 GTPase Era [Malacoplasma iowae]
MKVGVVSIVGKPNVGKSTLINAIFKKEVVISSSKPQTTRNKIQIVYKDDNSEILFSDTPGYHNPKNKLDLFLNSQVKKSLKNTDVIVFLFDISRKFDDEDQKILDEIKKFKIKKIILGVNKIDLVNEQDINSKIETVKQQMDFDEIIFLSSKDQTNIDKLMDLLKSNLEEVDTNNFYEKESVEQKEEFFVSEIIRQVIINNFRQEIPYSVAVVIDKMDYDETKNLLTIFYSIVVEKESQKPIIIGKNGNTIKKLGILIRAKLSEVYDCKLFLQSFVKVKKNWRDNNEIIKDLGYKK